MQQNQLPVIDLDPDKMATFDPHVWIGKGKIYPTVDTPEYISNAKGVTQRIPDTGGQYFPSSDTTVANFIRIDLPDQSNQLSGSRLELTREGEASFDHLKQNKLFVKRRGKGAPSTKEEYGEDE